MEDKSTADLVMNNIQSFFDQGDVNGKSVLNTFLKKYEHLFGPDCDALANENKLEYTQAHNDFCQMFEQLIERLISECGVSVEKFFQALKTLQSSGDSFYVDVLLSVTDYPTFVQMINDFKRQ